MCDAHHHLFDDRQPAYPLAEFRRDLARVPEVTSSVYVEVGTRYRADGPTALKPVGETEWVVTQDPKAELVAGIVAFADLRRGRAVAEVLDAHRQVAGSRLVGIRHAVAFDEDPTLWRGYVRDGQALASPDFAEGVAELAGAGLVFETWCYFHQLADLAALLARSPELPVVVDHLGGPAGVGRYAGAGAEVRAELRRQLERLAGIPTVHLKLGGLGMAVYGATPTDADGLVDRWGALVAWAIDRFGPERCLFESNFPVDRANVTYADLWAAYSAMAAGYSPAERALLFSGTARRLYGLGGSRAEPPDTGPPVPGDKRSSWG